MSAPAGRPLGCVLGWPWQSTASNDGRKHTANATHPARGHAPRPPGPGPRATRAPREGCTEEESGAEGHAHNARVAVGTRGSSSECGRQGGCAPLTGGLCGRIGCHPRPP